MPVVPINILDTAKARTAGSSKDFRMVNAYAEDLGEEDAPDWYVNKRPGVVEFRDYSLSTQGRGLFSWLGPLWAVFGNKVYKDATALTGTLGTTTGKIYFAETPTKLLIMDPTQGAIYAVDASTTALPTPEADADIPAAMFPGIVQLDTITFVSDSSNNRIYNSEPADYTTWGSTSFITPEISPDDMVSLARHINYLIAFGEDSIEFFRNAGNATGSILNRIDGYVTLVGVPAGTGATVQNIDDEVYFVAHSDNGGRFVAKYRSLTPERVSNTAVEESLDAEGTDISNAWALTLRFNGNTFYVLTLPTTAQKTWVLNLDNGMWSEWTSVVTASESYYDMTSAVLHGGATLVQGFDSGKVFTLTPSDGQDDGEDIYVEVQTSEFTGDTLQNKFIWRLAVVADQEAASPTPTLTIQWSDDNFATYSTARTVDLSDEEPFLTRCGSFKKRAFRFQYRADAPLRLKGVNATMELGHHGL